MKRAALRILAGVGSAMLGCALKPAMAALASADPACSAAWQQSVEARLPSGDRQGHGPDLGSDEWQGVVEFRLGLRGRPELPARDSVAWCRFVEGRLQAAAAGVRPSTTDAAALSARSRSSVPPACRVKPAPGSIAAQVCADPDLRRLDQQLAEVYAAAQRKAVSERPPVLKAEQRGWIRGRDDCWKAGADGILGCVRDSYTQRIVELQARYRLVPVLAAQRYGCDPTNPADEVVVSYFATEPPSLIAERGDQMSLMVRQPGADGARYLGRNESLWDKGSEIRLLWGYRQPELTCSRAR